MSSDWIKMSFLSKQTGLSGDFFIGLILKGLIDGHQMGRSRGVWIVRLSSWEAYNENCFLERGLARSKACFGGGEQEPDFSKIKPRKSRRKT